MAGSCPNLQRVLLVESEPGQPGGSWGLSGYPAMKELEFGVWNQTGAQSLGQPLGLGGRLCITCSQGHLHMPGGALRRAWRPHQPTVSLHDKTLSQTGCGGIHVWAGTA